MDKQDEMEYLLRNLGRYKPEIPEKIESKEEFLKNTQKIFHGRNLIVHAFKKISFHCLKKKYLNMKNEHKKNTEKNIFLQKKEQKLLLKKKRV